MQSGRYTPWSASISLSILVLLATMAVTPRSASARDDTRLVPPRARQGYYLSAGPLVHSSINTTSDGTLGPFVGGGFNIRLGEAITDWLDLGLGTSHSWSYHANYRQVAGHFSLEAALQPIKTLSVILGAGAGWSDFTRQQTGMDPVTGRFSGTYTIGVAWEIFLKRRRDPYRSGGIALTPRGGIRLSPNNPTATYALFLGINITWWSGLNKNRLELPIDAAY